MIDRNTALNLVKKHIQTENLVKHVLATKVIMRLLARYFDEDEESWGLAGLLHDIGYKKTKGNPEKHAIVGAKLLESKGVSPPIVQAVLAHADKCPRQSLMDKAL